MAKPTSDVFVRIDYIMSHSAVFMKQSELDRLKKAVANRPKGEAALQIQCKLQPEGKTITKMIVLDKVQEITP